MRSPAASYSMVLLRRVVAGKVETQLIVGEFYPKAYPKAAQEEGRFNAPNAYKVIATLDLDGDGKMEIVVGSHYYEGEETTIYRCDPKKSFLWRVIPTIAARKISVFAVILIGTCLVPSLEAKDIIRDNWPD